MHFATHMQTSFTLPHTCKHRLLCHTHENVVHFAAHMNPYTHTQTQNNVHACAPANAQTCRSFNSSLPRSNWSSESETIVRQETSKWSYFLPALSDTHMSAENVSSSVTGSEYRIWQRESVMCLRALHSIHVTPKYAWPSVSRSYTTLLVPMYPCISKVGITSCH